MVKEINIDFWLCYKFKSQNTVARMIDLVFQLL